MADKSKPTKAPTVEEIESFAQSVRHCYSEEQIRRVTAERKAYTDRISDSPDVLSKVENFNDYSLPDYWWKHRDMNMLGLMRKDFLVLSTLLPQVSVPIPDEAQIYEYNKLGDSGRTTLSNTYGQTNHRYDSVQGALSAVPMVIAETPYTMSYEDFLADARHGNGQIRSMNERNAMDNHLRKWEDILMNGTDEVSVNGLTVTGIRSTGTNRKRAQTNGNLRTGGGAVWDRNFTTLQQMFTTQGHNAAGPNGTGGLFILFVNAIDWEAAMDTEYSTQYPMKISEMFEKKRGIIRIVPTHSIPANEMWAVIPDQKWLRIPVAAMPMTTALEMEMPKSKHKFLIQSKKSVAVIEEYNGVTGVAGLYA